MVGSRSARSREVWPHLSSASNVNRGDCARVRHRWLKRNLIPVHVTYRQLHEYMYRRRVNSRFSFTRRTHLLISQSRSDMQRHAATCNLNGYLPYLLTYTVVDDSKRQKSNWRGCLLWTTRTTSTTLYWII